MNWKNLLTVAMMATAAMTIASCDDDEDSSDNGLSAAEESLKPVNLNFVDKTLQKTYEGLVDATQALIKSLDAKDYTQAGTEWKTSRQYWEWSEAFLFGAASGYGIDPHIDTWPFDAAAFERYMQRYPNLATDEDDQAEMAGNIATGQNLTGFHAIEYILFRNGEIRTDISANEAWFAKAAAEDLYLNACKLVAAWNGNLSSSQKELLEEAEFEYDNFGNEFKNAGEAGSRWSTITLASIQIIEGCSSIVDEVAHAKIGAPYDGGTEEDRNYIESPHAYNSITDFYDNIMSCKHALYGMEPSTANYSVTVPADHSLLAYCQKNHATEAKAVMTAIEEALSAINAMPKPFVNNAQDVKVGVAIGKLEILDSSLKALQKALDK